MEKSKISINITVDDIDNALMGMIDLNVKNRKDVVKLLGALIYDNVRGAEWFMKMAVGGKYPTMPTIGDIGWIRLSDHNYTFSKERKEEMEESPLNQHGYFPCSIANVCPIHTYSPLVINLANVAGPGIWTVNIDTDKFFPGESIDIYEDLPI